MAPSGRSLDKPQAKQLVLLGFTVQGSTSPTVWSGLGSIVRELSGVLAGEGPAAALRRDDDRRPSETPRRASLVAPPDAPRTPLRGWRVERAGAGQTGGTALRRDDD